MNARVVWLYWLPRNDARTVVKRITYAADSNPRATHSPLIKGRAVKFYNVDFFRCCLRQIPRSPFVKGANEGSGFVNFCTKNLVTLP
jgi:hypothetical protein